MIVWRLSNHVALDGGGGLRASGRWHSKGRPIVYSASPATALLEVLVRLEIDPGDLPSGYRLLEIDLPDGASVEEVVESSLPSDWRSRIDRTQALGDDWLASAHSLALRVPCAVIRETNFLLNPSHPEQARVQVRSVEPFGFDPRPL